MANFFFSNPFDWLLADAIFGERDAAELFPDVPLGPHRESSSFSTKWKTPHCQVVADGSEREKKSKKNNADLVH